jgi:hypothetical protein
MVSSQPSFSSFQESNMIEPTEQPDVATEEHQDQATHQKLIQALAQLKGAGDSGANWFFWIAALSLVNTAITHSGGQIQFIVGLGITLIVDAIASVIGKEHPDAATVATAIAVGFSVFVSMIVALFGWLSRKRILWIYGIGMFLYLLDGLLYLLLGVYASAAFHGYALYCMFQGFNAYRKFNQFERAATQAVSDDSEPARVSETGFESA